MTFTLPRLTYSYDALEPYLDAQTMELHHSKHHQGYVDKLNAAAAQLPAHVTGHTVEKLLTNLDNLPGDIRTIIQNAGGGHANHSLFWTIIGPNSGGKPNGALAEAIDHNFGSIGDFKDQFTEVAVTLFGSGWAWLTINDEGQFSIVSTTNQDTPLSQKQTPLLTLDIWEHAYYLKYQNRRSEYIEAWWSVVNWNQVSKNYLAAKNK